MKKNDDTPIFSFLRNLLMFLGNEGYQRYEPAENSPAANEIQSFPQPEFVQRAFYQASELFESATDHLKAFDALLHMGRFSIAPWSCARGMVEVSTLCAWLLEVGIDAKERVRRSLSLTRDTLKEQRKMANYEQNGEKIQNIERRIEEVEKTVTDLGFLFLRGKDKSGRAISLTLPCMTELIEKHFGGENLYRMLSGLAHSNYVDLAIYQHNDPEEPGGSVLIRAFPKGLELGIVSGVVQLYAECAWLRTIQFGFNAAKMTLLLEELYDQLKLADKERFWRIL